MLPMKTEVLAIMSNENDSDWDFTKEMFELEGVKPIEQDNRVYHGRQSDDLLAKQLKREAIEKELGGYRNHLTTDAVQPVAPEDIISYKKDGVQEGVYKNLRLGKYKIESAHSLQGMNFKSVHESVFQFIVENYNNGNRAVLIKHGMGLNSKPYPAFYKSYINRWLQDMPEVLAFHSALKQHGGYGAVYVLLKKNEKQKQDNREFHRAR